MCRHANENVIVAFLQRFWYEDIHLFLADFRTTWISAGPLEGRWVLSNGLVLSMLYLVYSFISFLTGVFWAHSNVNCVLVERLIQQLARFVSLFGGTSLRGKKCALWSCINVHWTYSNAWLPGFRACLSLAFYRELRQGRWSLELS